jgi:hypothetical protein
LLFEVVLLASRVFVAAKKQQRKVSFFSEL